MSISSRRWRNNMVCIKKKNSVTKTLQIEYRSGINTVYVNIATVSTMMPAM